jgi:hypothetical protein
MVVKMTLYLGEERRGFVIMKRYHGIVIIGASIHDDGSPVKALTFFDLDGGGRSPGRRPKTLDLGRP